MATERNQVPADRELDALIAEKFMGYKWFLWPDSERRFLTHHDTQGFRDAHGDEPLHFMWFHSAPHFSTELTAAWLVLGKIQAEGWDIHIDYDATSKQWYVEFSQLPSEGLFAADSDTVERAICLAAKSMHEEEHTFG